MHRGEKEMYYWGSPIEITKQDKLKRIRDWFINDGLTDGFHVDEEFVRKNVQA